MICVGGSRPPVPMMTLSATAVPRLSADGLVSWVMVKLRLSPPGRNSDTVAVTRTNWPSANVGALLVNTKMPSEVLALPSEAPCADWM